MTGSVKRAIAGSAVVLVGLAFGGSVLGTAARAADDGYDTVFSSVLSTVGLAKTEEVPDIAYRERPPLVLPPKLDLPKPVGDGPKHSAAWPRDPDVAKKRKAADEARGPVIFRNEFRNNGNSNGVLGKDELLKSRAQTDDTAPSRPNYCGVNDNSRACLIMSPDELKAESDRFNATNTDKSDKVVAGQEPPRVYLTQPPKGYLKATETVKATNDGPEAKEDTSAFAFFKPHYKEDE